MIRRFKARIGRERVGGAVPDSIGSATLDVRSQMNAIIQEYFRWTQHMEEQADDVLYEALKPTFEKTQQRVPLKDGDLIASGYLEKRTFRGNATVEIGYAKGGSPEYAIEQHENLEYNHAEGRTAKYLERPLLEDADAIQSAIMRGFREAANV